MLDNLNSLISQLDTKAASYANAAHELDNLGDDDMAEAVRSVLEKLFPAVEMLRSLWQRYNGDKSRPLSAATVDIPEVVDSNESFYLHFMNLGHSMVQVAQSYFDCDELIVGLSMQDLAAACQEAAIVFFDPKFDTAVPDINDITMVQIPDTEFGFSRPTRSYSGDEIDSWNHEQRRNSDPDDELSVHEMSNYDYSASFPPRRMDCAEAA